MMVKVNNAPTKHFLRATHVSGVQLYVWLTQSEMYTADDDWDPSRVTGCEDRDGEMIPHDVRLADLEDFEPV